MSALQSAAATSITLLAATFGFSLLGGLIPVLNVEVYLVAVATVAPRCLALSLILLAASGQMVAKSALYLAGRSVARLPGRLRSQRMQAAAERIRSRQSIGNLFLLGSAVTGLPPFYAVSIASGALKVPFARFLVLGLFGALPAILRSRARATGAPRSVAVRCLAAVFEPTDLYDAVVIGSGFGGSMAAHALVRAGQTVLMLERGDWVSRGPHNWMPGEAGLLTSHYSMDAPYRVLDLAGDRELGAFHCVGGPSVFYGGVSLRFRVEDFEHDPEIAAGSDARWPFAYRDLEPYYGEVERILGVAGETGGDPTEPPRSTPFPQAPAPLSPTSRLIADAARGLGLEPFRVPLAINYTAGARNRCIACGTCDGYACAITAKNDLATTVIQPLLRHGLELRTNTVVTRLVTDGSRISAVEWVDRMTGRKGISLGRRIVLAAGALASPHLLLAARLQRLNPGGHTVGRFLMRHYTEAIFGVFRHQLDPADHFHKQLCIHDLYFGDPCRRHPRGKLGGIQQLATPGQALVRAHLPRVLGSACTPCLSRLNGLLIIAEDQPQYENRVALDPGATDRFGVPRLVVSHRYTSRDLAAGRTLASKAKEILHRAGAWACYRHRIGTFSHAVGTVRMGVDPRTSALDLDCRFRGVENLYVVDGSGMPTSGGVNPSLTIAANALRAAQQMLTTGSQNRRSHQHDLIRC